MSPQLGQDAVDPWGRWMNCQSRRSTARACSSAQGLRLGDRRVPAWVVRQVLSVQRATSTDTSECDLRRHHCAHQEQALRRGRLVLGVHVPPLLIFGEALSTWSHQAHSRRGAPGDLVRVPAPHCVVRTVESPPCTVPTIRLAGETRLLMAALDRECNVPEARKGAPRCVQCSAGGVRPPRRSVPSNRCRSGSRVCEHELLPGSARDPLDRETRR